MDVSKGHDKHCCVVQCVSNGRQNPNLSFHRFPPPGPKRNMWIWAIRRDLGPLFNVSMYTRHISDETVVCSKHFRSEDFKWTPVRKTLKPEAVPSIFNWSKVTEPRRKIIKHEIPQKKCKTEVSLRLETTVNVSKGLDETQQLHLNVGSTSTDEAACANIKDLEDQLKKKNEEVKQLQERLEIERFGVSSIPLYNVVMYIKKGAICMNLLPSESGVVVCTLGHFKNVNSFTSTSCGLSFFFCDL
ncbi:hypothetical protein KUTeg_015682 [Tegillarca granosa]|uniref:THAP-type domain-containing protein n=1 Tax=Tegillarca granosa TaxID=220873 RepID=A0ABQ9ETX8_TEGGR|nr:hypothetical protein KUTeg_015682 [Tegillarca granosa]